MYSHILNLNYLFNKRDNQNRSSITYRNMLMCDSSYDLIEGYIQPLKYVINNSSTFQAASISQLANYPMSNIYSDPSVYKEAMFNNQLTSTGFSLNVTYSGITLNVADSAISTFNTICLNFNKKNSNVKNYQYNKMHIVFRHLTTQSLSKYIYINGSTISLCSMSGIILSSTNIANSILENGNFLIDKKMLYNLLGSENISRSTYEIDIYTLLNGDYSSDLNFSISNIFIGNAIEFYPDEEITFGVKNNNNYAQNQKTSKTFIEKNGSLKTCNFTISMLTYSQMIDNENNIYKFNKDAPIFFFPYNNFNGNYTYDSNCLKWDRLNYLYGDLFYINNDKEIKNTVYNVFDYSLELKEFK